MMTQEEAERFVRPFATRKQLVAEVLRLKAEVERLRMAGGSMSKCSCRPCPTCGWKHYCNDAVYHRTGYRDRGMYASSPGCRSRKRKT